MRNKPLDLDVIEAEARVLKAITKYGSTCAKWPEDTWIEEQEIKQALTRYRGVLLRAEVERLKAAAVKTFREVQPYESAMGRDAYFEHRLNLRLDAAQPGEADR